MFAGDKGDCLQEPKRHASAREVGTLGTRNSFLIRTPPTPMNAGGKRKGLQGPGILSVDKQMRVLAKMYTTVHSGDNEDASLERPLRSANTL